MICAAKLHTLSRHLPFVALTALGALAAACGGETDDASTSSGSNIGVRDDADGGDPNNQDGGSEASTSDGGLPGEEEIPCSVTPTGLECPIGFHCALYDTPGEGGVCFRP